MPSLNKQNYVDVVNKKIQTNVWLPESLKADLTRTQPIARQSLIKVNFDVSMKQFPGDLMGILLTYA